MILRTGNTQTRCRRQRHHPLVYTINRVEALDGLREQIVRDLIERERGDAEWLAGRGYEDLARIEAERSG